jgi:hypothetical protein
LQIIRSTILSFIAIAVGIVRQNLTADILMREAKKLGDVDDMPISILLLEGLKETWPIQGGGEAAVGHCLTC